MQQGKAVLLASIVVVATLCAFILLQPETRRYLPRGLRVAEQAGCAHHPCDDDAPKQWGTVQQDPNDDSGSRVDKQHHTQRRRQAAIILFGRATERGASTQGDPGTSMLRRVHGELLKYVIEPNAHQYNFTSIIRLDADDAAVFTDDAIREQYGDSGAVIVSELNPLTINELSVYGCGYRMWTNIEMGVRKMGALEAAYGTADPVRWGNGFEMVLVIRAEVHINSVFEFGKLNPQLFYMANFCSPVLRRGKKVTQLVRQTELRCLPNETMSIPPTRWPQRQVAPNAATASETASCGVHRLECRVLQPLGTTESRMLTMPDYFFIGNSSTMREMFEFIVEDWHEGKFRKAPGHCNHGVLGGRLLFKAGRVRCGRYLYHKIDVEIPRLASWFPSPSLHEYLNARGALWDSPIAYNIFNETFYSVCYRTVCTIRDAEVFHE